MVEYKNSRYRVFDIVAAGKSLSQIRRDIFAGVQGNPPRNTPTPVFTLKMSPFETFFFLSSFRRAKIVDPRDTDSPLSPRIRLLNALRTGDGSKETFPLRGRRILF